MFETTRRIRRARKGLTNLQNILQRENVVLQDVKGIENTLRERELASLEHNIAVSDVKEIIKNASYIARVARDNR